MPRGQRKSIEQHVLDGTYRAYRHGPLTADNSPSLTPLTKPANLTPAEGVAWDELVVLLAGVVKPRDSFMLVELCRWVVRANAIAEALASMKVGAKGHAQMLTMSAIATDKVNLLSGRFGLSPSDRAKLGANDHTPVVAKVKTRPVTKLDARRPPAN